MLGAFPTQESQSFIIHSFPSHDSPIREVKILPRGPGSQGSDISKATCLPEAEPGSERDLNAVPMAELEISGGRESQREGGRELHSTPGYVTLRKSLQLPGPQFPHLGSGNNASPYCYEKYQA